MNDKLKQFVSRYRREFDTSEPGQDLWKKIEAQMDEKPVSGISSKWLSAFKYLGFSLSVLVVAVYFVTKNVDRTSEKAVSLNKKASATNSVEHFSTHSNGRALNTGKATHGLSDNKNRSQVTEVASMDRSKKNQDSVHNYLPAKNEDSVLAIAPLATDVSEPEKKTADNFANKPESRPSLKNKKTAIYIPADPLEMNTYTGTLYESAFLCPLVSAYKFPGKVDLSTGRGIQRDVRSYRIVVKTISCSYLSGMPNIKAVWLKGRTDKEITLAIKKKFKNIVLVKSDGRKFHPEAISHYYPGRGVISDYKGRYFNMVFKDKVELLLFFKDAAEGDRVIIDGNVETIIKNAP